jgi:hypothetical protein
MKGETMKMTFRSTALAAGLAAAFLATGAQAEIDATCFANWKQAVTNQQMGAKCKWITPALDAKLKAAETSSYACASAKATEAEKADLVNSHVPATRKFVGQSMSDMPCNDQAKKYFDEQVAKLP